MRKMIFCGFAVILLFFLYKIIFQGDFPYRRYTMACANNLRHTYTALMQYANQNKGYFPAANTVEVLIDGNFIQKNFFKCPYLFFKHPDIDDISSYLFLCEGKNIGDGIFPLAMDKKRNHEKHPINILYSDNSKLRLNDLCVQVHLIAPSFY